MIKLSAETKPYDEDNDAIYVTVETGGILSDMKDELEKLLYQLYKQVYAKAGTRAVHSMCVATKDAMEQMFKEIYGEDL